jgi:hypothetical protein
MCLQLACLEEAEVLLSSIATTLHIPKPWSPQNRLFDGSVSLTLATLKAYTTFTGRPGLLYRTLERLLQNRVLPAMWLATKDFGELWNDLIQSITSRDAHYTYSASFFRAAMESAIHANIHNPILPGTEDCPLQIAHTKTSSSVLATLTAITILRQELSGSAEQHSQRSAVHLKRLLQSIFVRYYLYRNSHPGSSFPARSPHSVFIMYGALLVGDWNAAKPSRCLQSCLWELVPGKNNITTKTNDENSHCKTELAIEAGAFLSSVARCCGKAVQDDGFEYMKRIESIVLLAMKEQRKQIADLHRSIIVESAYGFAKGTRNRQHQTWAEDLEQRIYGYQESRNYDEELDDSLEEDDFGLGYRWEEGISEWVARTPAIVAIKNRRHQVSISSFCESDSEVDSPAPAVHREIESIHQQKKLGSRTRLSSETFKQNPCRKGQHSRPDNDHDELALGASPPIIGLKRKASVLSEISNVVASRPLSSNTKMTKPSHRGFGIVFRRISTLSYSDDDSGDELGF